MAKTETMNAVTLLKEDHAKVKKLFDQFEKAKDERTKKEISQKAIDELKIHATIEEEIFYPALREALEDEDIMDEAEEEHHVAKILVAELDDARGQVEHYDAKFIVLAENVRHHIKEEEGEMFPKVKKTDLNLVELAEQMTQRKQELLKEGVPTTDEEEMVKGGHKEKTLAYR